MVSRVSGDRGPTLVRDKILLLLYEHEAMYITEIATILKKDRNYIRRKLEVLRPRGLVDNCWGTISMPHGGEVRCHYWRITDLGKAYVREMMERWRESGPRGSIV